MPNPKDVQFIFPSTGAVYGSANGRASQEEDRYNPCGNYARYKIVAEEIIKAHAQEQALFYSILRISNIYGFPSADGPPQGIVSMLIDAGLRGGSISLWGEGTSRKDYVFATDFAAAIESVIKQRIQGVLNLSYGKSHSTAEIVSLVEKVLGTKLQIKHLPAMDWDVKDNRIDSSNFQKITGWKAKISLEEGILQAVKQQLAYLQKVA